MNAPTIVNLKNFDVNKLTFVPGVKKPNRMPSITLKYDGKPFNIRFPSKMSVRMFAKTDDNTGNTSYSLVANMKNCDPYARDRATGGDVESLYNLLVFDLKEKILAVAEEKSKEWFGKKRERAAIKDSFKEMYRVSSDKIDGEYVPNGKYPPSVTLKIPVYDNKVATEVVDESRNPVDITPHLIAKVFENNTEVNMVASPSVYIMPGGGSFGVTWRLTYAQVFQKSKLNAAAVFLDDQEEEAEQSEEQQQEEQQQEEATPVVEQVVASVPARKKRSAAP
jgi:hypothetical protein